MRCQRSAARISMANTSFTRLCSVKKRGNVLERRRSATKVHSTRFVVRTNLRRRYGSLEIRQQRVEVFTHLAAAGNWVP
jgi:hypothetical protein